MSDEDRSRHQPLTGTGPHKRANEDRLLRQAHQSLRELHTRFGQLLDVLGSVLMDRQNRDEEEGEDVLRASSSNPRHETRAHVAPTVMHRAVTGDDLVERAGTRWAEAKTEADRAKVIEMLDRGAEQGLIPLADVEALLARLREEG